MCGQSQKENEASVRRRPQDQVQTSNPVLLREPEYLLNPGRFGFGSECLTMACNYTIPHVAAEEESAMD
ncbi:hypothetical protein ZHAS_00004688 [Anopheles sinensis]|uniref:Uncharacterized protein n=1 Tax=Anopheles sinensis TaxID=74873 RepID=A0A084VHE6_ANOSI|nr:hypothetical protein ZHAS_00004688 [Anopheles sinensis]